MLTLIAIYLALIFGLPVPDCPRWLHGILLLIKERNNFEFYSGYLGPGGKHHNAQYPNCTGGANGYIDRVILGNAHIYQHPTAKYVYGAQAFDPEGVFGKARLFLITFKLIISSFALLLLSTRLFADCGAGISWRTRWRYNTRSYRLDCAHSTLALLVSWPGLAGWYALLL